MPQVHKAVRPPAGGWRGLNPLVVIEVARLLKAVALIEADTPMARRLLAAWEGIDPDHPDAAAYARLLAELELSEVDCEEAVHSLLRDGQ